MAGQLGLMWTFPRWREWLLWTCARKTQPLGGIVRASPPKPVGPRQFSLLKPTALRVKLPLPCMPWQSCKSTKPRHSKTCTRVAPAWGWCRSYALQLTSLSGHLWPKSAIYGSIWQRWGMPTKFAYLMPPSPRQGYSATLSRTLPSSSRQCSDRLRQTSPSCPGVIFQRPRLRLSVAEGALLQLLVLLHPMLRPCWGRCVEPPTEVWSSLCHSWPLSPPRRWRNSPDTNGLERRGTALLQEEVKTAPLLPPESGQRILGFVFFLFHHWLKGISGRSLRGHVDSCRDEPECDAFWAIQHDFPLLHHCGYVDCPFGATCTEFGSMACTAQAVPLAHSENPT